MYNNVYTEVLSSSANSFEFSISYLVTTIIIAIISIIAMFKIFTKAGEAGWKSIIPIYNIIT